MRDRQLLAKEVEFLRNQLTSGNESDTEKLYFSGRGQVDSILHNVKINMVDEVRKASRAQDTNVKFLNKETDLMSDNFMDDIARDKGQGQMDPDKDVDTEISPQLS